MSGCRFFHWTTVDRLEFIAREGLLTRSQIERLHGTNYIQHPDYTRRGMVYLLEDKSPGDTWGWNNNRVDLPWKTGGGRIALCVDPVRPLQPDSHFNQPTLDLYYQGRAERTHPGRIPPERIRVHTDEGCVPIAQYVQGLAQAA